MKLNRTTMRTVDILKLVSKNPDGITLDGICEKLELPKTSAYDIVTTLVEMGMVMLLLGRTVLVFALRVSCVRNSVEVLPCDAGEHPLERVHEREVGVRTERQPSSLVQNALERIRPPAPLPQVPLGKGHVFGYVHRLHGRSDTELSKPLQVVRVQKLNAFHPVPQVLGPA